MKKIIACVIAFSVVASLIIIYTYNLEIPHLVENATYLPLHIQRMKDFEQTFYVTGEFNPYTVLGDKCKCCVVKTYYTCSGCWGACPNYCASYCLHKEFVSGYTYPEYSCAGIYTFTKDILEYKLPDGQIIINEYVLDEMKDVAYTGISIPVADAVNYIDFKVIRTFQYKALLRGPCNIDYTNSGLSPGQSVCYVKYCPPGTTTLINITWTAIWEGRWLNPEYTPPPQTLSGNIHGTISSDGNPLRGTIVLNVCSGGDCDAYLSVTANEDGEYEINQIPVNTYEVSCGYPGYITQSKIVAVENQQTVLLHFELEEVPKTGIIKGTTRDENGINIDGVKVEVEGYKTTSINGEYIMEVPENSYEIRASKDGYRTIEHLVTVTAGHETIQNFTLSSIEENGTVVGTVRNADTTVKREYIDLEGATIEIKGVSIEGATISTGEYEAISDENGNFMLDVPAGTYDIVARKVGYQSVTLSNVEVEAGETKKVYFNLPPLTTKGEISGDVRNLDGEILVGVVIEIEGPDINEVIETKSDGTFILGNLTPGQYNLVFNLIGYKELSVTELVEAGKITSMHIYMAKGLEENPVVDIYPVEPEDDSGEYNGDGNGIILLMLLLLVGGAAYIIINKMRKKKKRRKKV